MAIGNEDGCPVAVMATGADVKLRSWTLSGCDGTTATTAEEEPLSEGLALSPKKKRPHRQVEEQKEEDQEKRKTRASTTRKCDAKWRLRATLPTAFADRLVSVGLMVAWLCQGASGVLNETPCNNVAKIGEMIQLYCGTNVTNGTVKIINIYTGYKTLKSYCSGNFSNGLLTLSCEARTELAGPLTCLEPGTLQQHTSRVIVGKGDPKCTVSANETCSVFECNFPVWGGWKPTITLTGHGKQGSTDLTAKAKDHWKDGEFSFSLEIPKKSGIMEVDLNLCFELTKKPADTDANNLPNYTFHQNIILNSGGSNLPNYIIIISAVTLFVIQFNN